MKLGDVLQRVPGLEKRFVYYLEAQGDIHPVRLPKTRIARRDYGDEDVRRISRLWDYYRRGYSLARARELVAGERGDASYVFLRVAPRDWPAALELLGRSDRVLEATAVYGESADIVARLETPRPEDAFELLHEVFDRGLLVGPPSIRRARPVVERDGPAMTAPMLAYVLLKMPAKHVDSVLDQLRTFDGIAEAAVVYGETDIIARLEVPDQAALDELVLHRIQSIAAVESTRTFIAAGSMQWRRGE